jgi:uncharacterized protein YpmS
MEANENENGNHATIWKTIALVLVTILITGTPGIVYALRTWSLNDEVGLIRERQDDVRDRLARIEAQREDLESEIEQLHARIDYLVNQTP